ncbi:MAG: glycoside hydrolase family 95 protein [Clostridia bacterium]|nr:glycoside hydrolase family 95 protein [Clostridia bacterium]
MAFHILHLENPACEWENSSPVGNGRQGMCIFGGTKKEYIYLNEESVWSSDGNEGHDPDFRGKLDKIRALFLQGRNDEGEELAKQILDGSFSRIHSYETAGRLVIDFAKSGEYTGYYRDIDLVNGVAAVGYDGVYGKTRYTAFCSKPDDIMCYCVKTENAADFRVEFERLRITDCRYENAAAVYTCSTALGEHLFCVGIKVCTDGELSFDNGFSVKNARDTVIYIDIQTAFKGDDFRQRIKKIDNLEKADFDGILGRHEEDFSALMTRSEICLRGEDFSAVPVGERLAALRDGKTQLDPGLISLYFDFGKYLLASSSRPGCLPANLQGIWAEKYENPWNSNYTININIQMNYWQCEQANIAECHEPLFGYLNNILLPSGQKTAKINYGARGTVAHHISDIYGFTAPGDGLWGQWPMSAAWFARHLWEHYLFGGDREYLKNEAYDYIKNCVMFFEDYLFEDGNGRLLSGPAASPENSYLFGKDKKKVYLGVSPTMDTEIISDLFNAYIETENILGIDPEYREKVKNMLSRLVPLGVGKYGQLKEWIEGYEESEPGHRHISHAYGLYPGCLITRETPELYAAIRKTLDRRLSFGGGHTGWSRAWLVNLFARLRDGEKAGENLRLLFTKSTKDNMFDNHPPFQIDGNFGGAAGICEMLIQSHEGFISLLPAVPESFGGYFKGLRARGGYTVSAEFENGRVKGFSVISDTDSTVKLELEGVSAVKNGENIIKTQDGFISFDASAGVKYEFIAEEK